MKMNKWIKEYTHGIVHQADFPYIHKRIELVVTKIKRIKDNTP